MANPLYDIAVYTVQHEGYLRGVFTNPGISNKVCQEIAKKKDGSPGLLGLYNCSYKSHNDKTYTGELTITWESNRYQFEWMITTEDGKPIALSFSGAGYDRADGRIAVYYREVEVVQATPTHYPHSVRRVTSGYLDGAAAK